MNLDRAYFTYLQQRSQWTPKLVFQFWVERFPEFFLFSFQTAATILSLWVWTKATCSRASTGVTAFCAWVCSRWMIFYFTELTSVCPSVFLPVVFREAPVKPIRICCLQVHGSRTIRTLENTVLDHSDKLLSRVYPNEYWKLFNCVLFWVCITAHTASKSLNKVMH